ncbi:MAG: hypothetical protein A2782_01320 [Candidatus Blackburnbacteria bacterium RIFCSPHIGHO2_01_FULL_43_15b]|uniref:Thymidylate synthase complementing protein ThyX n=1 Tax=Candidatus Blackburnbacteria bacterium RIFCSPHIGHO2_01_FULL_43_15b TaxID=1797513 RepID=A0A1G1UZ36_9BACT|nr:MAG: hypothetical protein A2782_01320 [Candidatus Blackburnbacteria bacterium RIFCSPHIGHO2_01_FULL_43_15b]
MDNHATQSAEKLTKEEAYFIEPFFTNLDKNVFAAKYLPSEVLGALASRYSRSKKGVRRLFFDEYIKPILEPNLEPADRKSIREAEIMRKELVSFVDYLHEHGGWEAVVNSRRARDFFARWLAAYGDDSIAQMAGAHLFLENISIVATKYLEDFRIGFAPLEKSTRYVRFDEKIGGKWIYFIEPNLAKSKYGRDYVRLLNLLFSRYSKSIEPLLKYLKRKYPQEKDQSDRAYLETMNAKTYDVLRTYLPAATFTNVGFFGVGQAFEYVITKCLASPLVELRNLAKQAQTELKKVIPSMVERATSPRGKIYQRYVQSTEKNLEKLTQKLGFRVQGSGFSELVVELVEYDFDAEVKIVAALLYKYSNLSASEIKRRVEKLTTKERLEIIKTSVDRRQVRQHRLVRAFENTYYKFDIVANLGAYRDLHRHRMLTQERQRFTTELGFDVPQDLISAKLDKAYVDAAKKIDNFYRRVSRKYPEQAQYVVMLGNRIRWYQWENLRELGWEAELRTGPQGHPDYRIVEQEKVRLVAGVHPTLISALKFVDNKSYDLARRESEKRIDKRLGLV